MVAVVPRGAEHAPIDVVEAAGDRCPVVLARRHSARHAELMPQGALSDIAARSAQVARLLTGYLVYLDRQIAEREPSPAAPPAGGASRDSVRVPA